MNAAHLGRRRDHDLRGARRRRASSPRPSTSPPTAAGRCTGRSLPLLDPVLGPAPVLLLQPVRVRRHRRAALVAQPGGRHGRRVRRRRRPLARDARRVRLPRLLPLRLRLRLPRARARTPPARCSDAATRPSASSREAAGGIDELLDRYAIVVLSDHGQTRVEQVRDLEESLRRTCDGALVTASNRAGMVYCSTGAASTSRGLAERLDGDPVRRSGAVPRGRRGRRAARGRGAPLRAGRRRLERSTATRPCSTGPTRPRARGRRSRSPERRRGARLGRGGLGVRRPRRPPSPGRRLPRLARSPATRRCRSSPSALEASVGTIVDVAPRVLRHFGVAPPAVRRSSVPPDFGSGTRERWWSGSSAAAASPTSGCSPRWRACRASSSSPSAPGSRLRGRGARRSATGRRSRSRSSSPRCASCSACDGDERVLDVGTGSGYAACVLAELAAEVVSIERMPELAEQARRGARRGRATRRWRCASATARSALPTGRRSTAIAVAAAAPGSPRRARTSSWPRAAGSCCRWGRALVAAARARRAHAGGAAPSGPRMPCRFVPLVGEEGFRDRPSTRLGDVRWRAPLRSPSSWSRRRRRRRRDQPRAHGGALRRRGNWEQLAKFCVVGATGYVVNLAVYTLLLRGPASTTCRPRSARSSSR